MEQDELFAIHDGLYNELDQALLEYPYKSLGKIFASRVCSEPEWGVFAVKEESACSLNGWNVVDCFFFSQVEFF